MDCVIEPFYSEDGKKLFITPGYLYRMSFMLGQMILSDREFLFSKPGILTYETGRTFRRVFDLKRVSFENNQLTIYEDDGSEETKADICGDNEARESKLFIIALWRGGASIGINVQSWLNYAGLKPDHIATRTSTEFVKEPTEKRIIRVHSLSYITKNARFHDKILIIDDVHDSGYSLSALLMALYLRSSLNVPHNIKIATLFYKPKNNKVGYAPDYYLEEVPGHVWIVFPHELEDMSFEQTEKMHGKKLAEYCRENKGKYGD